MAPEGVNGTLSGAAAAVRAVADKAREADQAAEAERRRKAARSKWVVGGHAAFAAAGGVVVGLAVGSTVGLAEVGLAEVGEAVAIQLAEYQETGTGLPDSVWLGSQQLSLLKR